MFGKPLLFLSAYSPLFLILAVRFQSLELRIAMAGISALGVLSMFAVLAAHRRTEPGARRIEDVREAGPEAASFLAAYLLPFVTVAEPTKSDLIAYAIFLIVAAAVHLRSAVAQVNPMLYVLGYRVYWATDDNESSVYLISRRRVRAGDLIQTSPMGDDVAIVR